MPELRHIISTNIDIIHKILGNTIPQPVNDVDIVVPVFNAFEDVKKCLQSLENNTDNFNVRIIVVNDGSAKETSDWLRKFCKNKKFFCLIEHPTNIGYTKAVNTGLRVSTGSYIIIQNSDTIVTSGWLTGLIKCMNSSPKIGIVGPLSNAASWQSVPALRDSNGQFVINALPEGMGINEMAKVVRSASDHTYPKIPFVNGFCFMIKREVINKIGYMDDENFPVGYGEENDYCIRALDAGYELAIADDVYIFHAKSKSFGHERRKELSDQGTKTLRNKHSLEKYTSLVEEVKKTKPLDIVRSRIQEALDYSNREHNPIIGIMDMRILFLLPVMGGNGGAHSVVQEAAEMCRLGFTVRVAVSSAQLVKFQESYEDILSAKELFIGVDDFHNGLIAIAEDYDVIIGTVYHSMEMVKRVIEENPHILPAYYVQDYEPLFFTPNSEKWSQAYNSYTLVPGAFLFAKTNWIIQQVNLENKVKVNKVLPSIDHDLYKPLRKKITNTIIVAAMIRPQTPRRGAARTMRLFSKLYKIHGKKLQFEIFGCVESSQEFKELTRDFPYTNHGILKRHEVARLLGNSDLFVDLSDYQAFGRTALEAMATGCAAAVPAKGGGNEYAINGENTVVVDTLDEDACFYAINMLLGSSTTLRRLQREGLRTASRYSVHAAAVSELVQLWDALSLHRLQFQKQQDRPPVLYLLPSLRGDGKPAGSGYVRVVLPYQTGKIKKNWQVKLIDSLPNLINVGVIVIQRDGPSCSMDQLKDWCINWKKSNGKIIYEIDDDLFDEDGLRQRGFKQDTKALVQRVKFLASIADIVTVSTPTLEVKLSEFNQNIRLIPNYLDKMLWQLDSSRNHSEGPFARSSDAPVRIGYIGTPTHNADLELVAEAMRVIEKKYSTRIELEVIGGFQNTSPLFGKRVGLPKSTEYPQFVQWLLKRVHWDIGIIPLTNDKFNQSKSNLKFIEYASLDMAIAVSDVTTYANIAQHGQNCLVVKNNSQDWINAVSTLIENRDLRTQLSFSARSQVQKNYLLCKNEDQLMDVLMSVMPGVYTLETTSAP